MKPSLLELLCCTGCRSSSLVVDESDGLDDVETGRLVCTKCARSFPITGGVPRFVPDDLDADKKKTADCFGPEWQRFDELGDEFERNLLGEFIHPLTPEIFRDAIVLEGGCGSGRNIRRIAGYGARTVVGVDLSSSVDVARRKTSGMDNVHVVQCDLLDLPFAPIFDVVLTAGVLHHLPVPRKGFDSMIARARDGATVVHTVYSREGNAWLKRWVDPLRLTVTHRLPPRVLYALSFLLALPAYLLLLLVYKPVNEIHALQPLRRYLFYNEFAYLFVRLGFRALVTQIYDQLGAPTAHLLTREQLETWVAEAGLKRVRFHWRNRNCWNFSGIHDGSAVTEARR